MNKLLVLFYLIVIGALVGCVSTGTSNPTQLTPEKIIEQKDIKAGIEYIQKQKKIANNQDLLDVYSFMLEEESIEFSEFIATFIVEGLFSPDNSNILSHINLLKQLNNSFGEIESLVKVYDENNKQIQSQQNNLKELKALENSLRDNIPFEENIKLGCCGIYTEYAMQPIQKVSSNQYVIVPARGYDGKKSVLYTNTTELISNNEVIMDILHIGERSFKMENGFNEMLPVLYELTPELREDIRELLKALEDIQTLEASLNYLRNLVESQKKDIKVKTENLVGITTNSKETLKINSNIKVNFEDLEQAVLYDVDVNKVQWYLKTYNDIEKLSKLLRDVTYLSTDRNGYLYNEIGKMLIDKGADPNYIDEQGYSLLSHTVYRQNIILTRQLIEAGADKSFIQSDGKSLIESAEETENEELIQLFQ
ncbi:hypothetical protein SM124_01430 [Bacillus sp. 31A1R]|uniref:Ankyrin repeat-containing protein n=1 Tax=Robertmurraya mangrovi TaxID=3098077 RepID=A0ABU5ITB7_9BACI|nr:hypothetical protein [Bacillus sp. 31A1R]MDZ5470399.1 hypothetical protein [Bacillus sp. 31A1R]